MVKLKQRPDLPSLFTGHKKDDHDIGSIASNPSSVKTGSLDVYN